MVAHRFFQILPKFDRLDPSCLKVDLRAEKQVAHEPTASNFEFFSQAAGSGPSLRSLTEKIVSPKAVIDWGCKVSPKSTTYAVV